MEIKQSFFCKIESVVCRDELEDLRFRLRPGTQTGDHPTRGFAGRLLGDLLGIAGIC